jgi:hypothetical protein
VALFIANKMILVHTQLVQYLAKNQTLAYFVDPAVNDFD